MELNERDLADILELVRENPGAPLSELKIKSRHARARVRVGTQHLAERGELVEFVHANTPHYWVAEDAPDTPEAAFDHDTLDRKIDQRSYSGDD